MIMLVFSLILMCVSFSGTTNGSEVNCVAVVKMPRNTVFVAPVMTELKINCTVTLHGCPRNPRIKWCKITGNDCKALNYSNHIRSEWKNFTEHGGMAFLVFLNISMEDTGFYRCKEGDTSVSHAINVTVTDNVEDKVSQNQSNPILGDLNTPPTDDLGWLWPYVYTCSGTVGLVFMAVSFFYVVRCQGRNWTRKDMENKNQYMDKRKNDLLHLPHLCLDSDLLTYVVYRV
ncbi:uncharacterized protein LOC127170951 [Labeo rohita]|uniref:uncharacterized protein LOC127170951 n=1 Tax=Labeo rohita TaxID=84645 RepID=UPI0021E1FA91|nr:uncharacterized protein LOC127170951 [Labeo rohita]